MEKILSLEFTQIIAGIFSVCSIIAFFLSLKQYIRMHALRLFSISIICSLSLFCNNVWVYFASIFIIATTVTETEFLQNLAAIVRGNKEYFDYMKGKTGQIPPSQVEENPQRRPMELKILNTLWTKQVNKFPDFSGVWTFRINVNAPEFMEFREAGNKLMGEGLIGETDQGQFYLTSKGFEYCKSNYKDFGSDQWWPEETISKENLKKILNKGN